MEESKTTEVNAPRIAWVDMLKGLAIVLVVIGHNSEDTVRNFPHALILSVGWQPVFS